MRTQNLFAIFFAPGIIAGWRDASYIPKNKKLEHRYPERFPWPKLLDYYEAWPRIWYHYDDIKIWVDDRKRVHVRDSTRFNSFKECERHCMKYSVVYHTPIDKPTAADCKKLCQENWKSVGNYLAF
ncbi:hypothetical protein PpBr36_08531 [Pyricularia pennisetigena]|uniref:hypothetical protein n=1 Tax=Pyricularia pennisetigena TaxID=1578925 RepID=UPI001151B8C1|nr:hypothetical protein PpBr36_08531 [Pyricularia pennisetigena]TLS24342.1 hypothetical protein PpBr36_08531 [Pyricularia pennisetigena]